MEVSDSMSGRNGARDAGSAKMETKLLLGLWGFGLTVGLSVLISVSMWVSVWITGEPQSVRKNPLENFILTVFGKAQWTLLSGVVFFLLLGLVIAGGVLFFLRKPKGKAIRVDKMQKYLAPQADFDSLSRSEAERKALKWMPDKDLAEKHPGLVIGEPITRAALPAVSKKKSRGDRKVYADWEALWLIVCGPRMGKTTSYVIPAIVDAPGNVLTSSNKPDIVYETSAITEARGQVWVFDPQDIATNYDQPRWFYNPLSALMRDPYKMDEEAKALADIFRTAALGADASSGDNAYFVNSGTELLQLWFMAAALDGLPITECVKWAGNDKNKTPITILTKHKKLKVSRPKKHFSRFPDPHDESSQEWEDVIDLSPFADSLMALYNITDKTRLSVFSMAKAMLAFLASISIPAWVTPNPKVREFHPDEFVRQKSDTMYVLSQDGASNAAALTTALIAAITKAAERYGLENGNRLPVPMVCALDEAANVVKWPDLPRLYSHYGSRSIILMTILQSYNQGVGVWGKEGMELLWSAAAVVVYGGGVRDNDMLERLEKLVGDYEEWEQSVSHSEGTRSVSSSKKEKKILIQSELASLGEGRVLAFISKRSPMALKAIPFWKRHDWDKDITALLPKEQ